MPVRCRCFRVPTTGSDWLLHAEGVLSAGSVPPRRRIMSVWPPVGASRWMWRRVRAAGRARLRIRPAFRGLTAMWRRGDEVFAEVALPADAGVSAAGFGVHPVLLDAALHAVILASRLADDGLPKVGVGAVLLAGGVVACRGGVARCGRGSRRWVRRVRGVDRAGRRVGVAGVVGGVDGGPAGDGSAAAGRGVGVGPGPALRGHLVGAAVAALSRCSCSAGAATDIRCRRQWCSSRRPWPATSWRAVYAATHAVLAVLQSWLARDGSGVLVVATRGAVALPGEDVTDLAGAAVWGLVRSAQTEHPGRVVLVDSDGSLGDTRSRRCWRPVSRRWWCAAGRCTPPGCMAAARSAVLLVPPGDGPWRLGMSSAGTLRICGWSAIPDADAPLGPGQVRVALSAVGANFRDVMIALGLYPDGGRRHGRRGVRRRRRNRPRGWPLRGRRRVMGLFPEGTGTIAVDRPAAAGQGAGGVVACRGRDGPVVFATAYYALVDLADVQAGAAGVGARRHRWGGDGRGAVGPAFGVWRCSPPPAAASGTPCGRWALTRTTSADSRSLEFEDKFRAVTGGPWHGCGAGLAGR